MYNNCMNDDYDLTVPFTLERHLESFKEYSSAAQLIDSFHIIRDNMKKNLKSIIMMFPHYSDHSHEHSENIISAIERLLGRKRIEKLSPSDTWMLLVCAYMHDLGMLIQGKEIENDWTSETFQEYLQNCKESSDDSLKKAAYHVQDVKWVSSAENNWPVSVYRDVILLASEFYRRKHPERSMKIPLQSDFGKYFNVVISGDGRLPPRIQDVIGKICFSHGIDFDKLLNLLEPADSLFGYEFHPRFVAVMLCLGDLCDLDNGRFNKMSMEVFGKLTKNNYVHYYKHESVSSFVLKKDLIAVNFNIKNTIIKKELEREDLFSKSKNKDKDLQDVCDRILLETQNWLGWIEELVKNIKLHWDKLCMEHIEIFSPTLKYKILVDGNETVSSKKNMRFSFSNEKAYELIESYSLYNNHFVFIRELLQNSVDALKRKFWTDIKSGRWDHFLKDAPKDKDGNIDYKNIQPFDFSEPEVFDSYRVFIKVEHEPGKECAKFTITDNGTGISKEDLQKRILLTGMRGKDKSVEKMPNWLKPTSSFGIGLHSVFGVSDSIFIKTSTSSDQNIYNINMHSSKNDGYVFLSLSDDQNIRFCNSATGTRMEIGIDVSKFDNFDFDKDIGRNIFAERPESDFCNRVQQELEDCLGLSLFDISYQFNDDDVIHTNRIKDDNTVKLLFDKDKCNHIFYPDKPFNVEGYDFALSQNGKCCILWDRKKEILMLYDIRDIHNVYDMYTIDDNYGVYCKGFKISQLSGSKNIIFSYDSIVVPFFMDYWGGNTKDIIDVSRNNLTHEQEEQNEIIFSKATECLAKIYYEVLNALLNSQDIEEWHTNVDNFVQPYLQKKTDGVIMPDIENEIIKHTEKYIRLGFNEDAIKNLLLAQAFCKLVKNYEDVNLLKNWYNWHMRYKNDESEPDISQGTYILDFIENGNIGISYGVYKTILENELLGDFNQECGFEYFDTNETYQSSETNLIDVYFSISIAAIIYLLLWTGTDISSLETDVRGELSYLPGYNYGYCFKDKRDVGDIIFSSELEIARNDYRDLFFLKERKIKKVTLSSEKELRLVFDKEYNKRDTVEYVGEGSFAVCLYYYNDYNDYIPIPLGLEDIAVNKNSFRNNLTYSPLRGIFNRSRTYITYLWDYFGEIKKTYTERIKNGEDIEKLADEIMPESRKDKKLTDEIMPESKTDKKQNDKKRIVNVLRNICYDRAFNRELPYKEAWNKVCTAYRKFVIKVLGAVKWLSEHEDELKKRTI